jgi:hypothetical protein
MTVIGFTAETSLYRTRLPYSTSVMHRQPAELVRPAYLDTTCFLSCYGDCNQGCFELTGTARGECLKDCKVQEQSCRERCTRPGPRPTPPPRSECDLIAQTPEFVRVEEGDLRIVGRGGRSCTGTYPPDERLHVLLREDIGWFVPDRTLAEREDVATGFDYNLAPVVYNCPRGESLTAYVETRNETTGEKVQSPRLPVWCV